jgi:hypothetical protein
MTSSIQIGIVVLIAQGLAGCGAEAGRSSVPSAPSSPTPPQSVVTVQQAWPPGVFAPNVTLSGVVFEITQGAAVPIEAVAVYCELCGEETHTWAYTDKKGFYSFKGIWGNSLSIQVGKDGYTDSPGPPNTGFPSGPGWRYVTINGDTRLDIQLVRK